MTLNDARERGRVAFEAGIPCAPIHDPGFTPAACASVGSTVDLLTAWHQGWTRANIDAPVTP